MLDRFDVTLENKDKDHPLRQVTFRYTGLSRQESTRRALEMLGDGYKILYVHGGLKIDISED